LKHIATNLKAGYEKNIYALKIFEREKYFKAKLKKEGGKT
jgi:hypothetical protein